MARKRLRPAKCKYRPVCAELRRLLKLGGVHRSTILHCPTSTPTTCPCGSFMGNARSLYHSLPGEHAEEALTFLSAVLGSSQPLLLPEFSPKSKQNDFYCPELRITMHQPCRVKSCPFRTQTPWLGNCVINYITKQERSSLNYNEMTFLLNESIGSVRSKVNDGLKKLRIGALRDRIKKSNDSGLVKLIAPQRYSCSVCERSPETGGFVRSKWYYCSADCYDYKPPAVLSLEAEYGIPVEKLLKVCREYFSSALMIAPLLHTTQPSLRDLYARYGVEAPQS